MGWASKVANRGAQNVDFRVLVRARLRRNLQGIPQRDQSSRLGIVRNKNRSEILIPGTGPFELAFQSIAAADALDGQARNVAGKDKSAALGRGVVVVIDPSRRIGSGSAFVAESRRPCGRCKNLGSSIDHRRFDLKTYV